MRKAEPIDRSPSKTLIATVLLSPPTTRMESGVLVLRPECCLSSTIHFVKDFLRERNLHVAAEGHCRIALSPNSVMWNRMYRKYSTYANIDPKTLVVDEIFLQKFQLMFRDSWANVLKKGLIFNCIQARDMLGMSKQELCELWLESHHQLSLKSGAILGRIKISNLAGLDRFMKKYKSDSSKLASTQHMHKLMSFEKYLECVEANKIEDKVDFVYVFNGFLEHLEESFHQPDATMHYFIIEWDESVTTWPMMLSDIIGNRSPQHAKSFSLRSSLNEHWESLGLSNELNECLNGVYFSNSAFDAMVDRSIWDRSSQLFTDEFALKLFAAKYSTAWVKNIIADASSVEDQMHGMNSEQCVQWILDNRNQQNQDSK